MGDYITWLRARVGHDSVLLNFAVAVIRDDTGRVLLQQRGDRGADAVWSFCGGAVELGESIEEAVIREVFEESGLEVETTGLLGVYSSYIDEYPNGDRAQPIVTAVVCRVVGGVLAPDGTEAIRCNWFLPDQLPTMMNRQHEDIALDVVTGRTGVLR